MELHGKYTRLRRRLARPSRPAAHRPLQARRRHAIRRATASASRSCGRSTRRRHKPGLALHTAGWPLELDTYGGSLLYHMDGQPGVGRLRRRPRLHEPVAEPVRGVPALEDASGDPQDLRRRQAHRLRRAVAHRRRHPVAARRLVFPGGALVGDDAGFLNASRIKGSHAAIKTGMLAAEAAFDAIQAGRAQRRAHGVPRGVRARAGCKTELEQARNFKQWFKKGLVHGDDDERHRAVAAAARRPQGAAVDGAPQGGRPSAARAGRRVPADRLPQARRRAHLRPPVVGVPQQHQPRRGPAGAPDAEGPGVPVHGQPAGLRRPREPLLPGRRLRVRRPTATAPSGCRSTPRTACTARPATSRIRRRTSSGSRPRAAAGRTTSACRRSAEPHPWSDAASRLRAARPAAPARG